MKLKQLIASISVVAVLLTTMAVTASAEETKAAPTLTVSSGVVNSTSEQVKLSITADNMASLGALQFELKSSVLFPSNVSLTQKPQNCSVNVKGNSVIVAVASATTLNTSPIELTLPAFVTNLTFANIKAWDSAGKAVSLQGGSGSIKLVTSLDSLKVQPQTTVAKLRETWGNNLTVRKNGVALTAGSYVTTDSVVELTNGVSKTVIIYGDVNKDGRISVSDISAIQDHIKGRSTLQGDALTAANVNKDERVSVSDISAIQDHIKGRSLIQQ